MRAPQRQAVRRAAAALLALAGCSDPAYLELQVADPVLPFLTPGVDFDAIRVDVRAEGCAETSQRFPAVLLPGSVIVVAGECYGGPLELRAAAALGDRDVARSAWIRGDLEATGAVLTATLADLPGRRTLFATGFEEGEPGGTSTTLSIATRRGFTDVSARVAEDGALTGARAAWLTGTATVAGARLLARAAVTNVAIAAGDELALTLELSPDSAVLGAGIELELDDGGTAASLGLVTRDGAPVSVGSEGGRRPGERQRWVVDLTPAAGARLVGVLFGAAGGPGALSLRLDDLTIARP